MHHLEIFLFLIKNQVLSRLYKSRQVSSFLIHKELDPDIQVNWPGRTNFGASDKEFNEAMHVRFIVLYIYICGNAHSIHCFFYIYFIRSAIQLGGGL